MSERDEAFRAWCGEQHTASHRDAFNAGWRAALDDVRKQDYDMVTLEQMLRERAEKGKDK